MTRASFVCLVLLALVLFPLMGCGLFRSGEEETPTPSPVGGTPRPTDAGTPWGTPPAGSGTPAHTPAEGGPATLVLWTSEDYAPTSETEGGVWLLEQIQAFQQSRGVGVEVILKKRSGIGGLLDFLTTASKAAPSVLPDLITLSDADLYRAARAGLLQPLDDLVSTEVLDDQFDFALALTRMDGATMGVLYQADVNHLIYDTMAFAGPPLSWRDVYSSTVDFVFSPAASAGRVNDVILIQYLAQGGKLTEEAGRPALDATRLAQTLEFFQAARQARTIPRSVLDMSDTTTAWATYRIGEAGMVQVPASLFLAERAGLSNTGFASVPLSIPGATTVGQGWALAVVTQDAERQQLAVALIEHLLAAENSGTWTQASGRLPTRHSAFGAWDLNDPYLPFIRNLLTQAQPAPNPDLAAAVGGPLAQALAEVLGGRATPAEAAEAAVEAVKKGQ